MASGMLGGGVLQPGVLANPYMTPTGKVTTVSLVLFGAYQATGVSLQFHTYAVSLVLPANGIITLSGIILGAGQSIYITTYIDGVRYLLTGWESTV